MRTMSSTRVRGIFHSNSITRNAGGFSLVELMITMGLMGAAALVSAQIFKQQADSQRSSDAKVDFLDFKYLIRDLVAGDPRCRTTLGLTTTLNIDPAAANGVYNLTSLTIPAPGGTRNIAISATTPGQIGKAYLTGAQILTTGQVITPGRYAAILRVTARKTPVGQTATGAQTMDTDFNIILIDSAPADSVAEACVGVTDEKTPPSEFVVAQVAPADCIGSTGAVIDQCLQRLAAAGGGSLLIKQGTYTGVRNLDVSANSKIRGEPGTILTGVLNTTGDRIFRINGNDVTIEGLTFSTSGLGIADTSHIVSSGFNSLTIRGNTFTNDTTTAGTTTKRAIWIQPIGLGLNPTENIIIEGNKFGSLARNGASERRFLQSDAGIIQLSGVSASPGLRGVSIRDNNLVGADGVVVDHRQSGHLLRVQSIINELSVSRNVFDSNRPCVFFFAGSTHRNAQVSDNEFRRCYKGLYVEANTTLGGMTIKGNIMTDVEDGITLNANIPGALISGNNISCRTTNDLLDDANGVSVPTPWTYGISLARNIPAASISANTISNCRTGIDSVGITAVGTVITANSIDGPAAEDLATTGVRVGSNTSVSANSIRDVQVGIWQPTGVAARSGLVAVGNTINGILLMSPLVGTMMVTCHPTIGARKVGICLSAIGAVVQGNRIYDMNIGIAFNRPAPNRLDGAIESGNFVSAADTTTIASNDYYTPLNKIVWASPLTTSRANYYGSNGGPRVLATGNVPIAAGGAFLQVNLEGCAQADLSINATLSTPGPGANEPCATNGAILKTSRVIPSLSGGPGTMDIYFRMANAGGCSYVANYSVQCTN